jgi:hypothetical protein
LQPTAFGGLGRRERRAILQAMRRGDRLPDDEAPITLGLVAVMRKTRWLPWLFFVVSVFQVGNVTHGQTARLLYVVSAAALWMSAWWQLYLRYRI